MAQTLLLAEENSTIQRFIELTFADQPIQVVSLGDGQLVVDRMKHERPDIVLASATLPTFDGYSIASFIQTYPSLHGVPVLLLAGAFDAIDPARVRESGAAGVLIKPFESAVVLNRVKELLGISKPLERGRDGRLVTPDSLPVPHAPTTNAAPPAQTPKSNVGPAAPPRHAPPVLRDLDDTRGSHQLPSPSSATPESAGPRPTGDATSASEGIDYFNQLDAAFDTLDAQLAGRPAEGKKVSAPPASLPAPPRDAARAADVAFTDRDSTKEMSQPATFGKDESTNPVFEIDKDWFADAPPADRDMVMDDNTPLADQLSAFAAPVAESAVPDSFVAPNSESTAPAPPAIQARTELPELRRDVETSRVAEAPNSSEQTQYSGQVGVTQQPTDRIQPRDNEQHPDNEQRRDREPLMLDGEQLRHRESALDSDRLRDSEPALDSHPLASSEPSPESEQSGYNQQRGSEEPTAYDTQTAPEEQTAYDAQTAPEEQTAYDAQTGYDEQPAYGEPAVHGEPAPPTEHARVREDFSIPKMVSGAVKTGVDSSVADAFDALFAEELGEAPPAMPTPPPVMFAPPLATPPPTELNHLSDDAIDRIASRVVEKLTHGVLGDTVRRVAVDVSERLVREEIERLRANSRR